MLSIILFLFLFTSSISLAQSVNVGVRLESLAYFYKNTIHNTNEVYFLPIPFSGYVKASISYDKYELELKGGVQLGEIFAGAEYALELKYNLVGDIFPLLVYLNHNNSGEGGNSGGPYKNTIEFVGVGAEAKLTKLFGVDLIYYIPVGVSDLEYLNQVNSNYLSERKTKSKITSMIKLGFIFNFNLF